MDAKEILQELERRGIDIGKIMDGGSRHIQFRWNPRDMSERAALGLLEYRIAEANEGRHEIDRIGPREIFRDALLEWIGGKPAKSGTLDQLFGSMVQVIDEMREMKSDLMKAIENGSLNPGDYVHRDTGRSLTEDLPAGFRRNVNDTVGMVDVDDDDDDWDDD